MVLQVLVALHYLVEMSILARFGIILQSVSFWQGLSMLTLWLGQYYCNTETEDRVTVYQFMRDLRACRPIGIGKTETVDVFYQEMK